jgi:hypothetical protein
VYEFDSLKAIQQEVVRDISSESKNFPLWSLKCVYLLYLSKFHSLSIIHCLTSEHWTQWRWPGRNQTGQIFIAQLCLTLKLVYVELWETYLLTSSPLTFTIFSCCRYATPDCPCRLIISWFQTLTECFILFLFPLQLVRGEKWTLSSG